MLEETIKRIEEEQAIKFAEEELNITPKTDETSVQVGEAEIVTIQDSRGRKLNTFHRTIAINKLHEASLPAVKSIMNACNGKSISWQRLDASKYVLDQVIGKAKTRLPEEHEMQSYERLLKMAIQYKELEYRDMVDAEFTEGCAT